MCRAIELDDEVERDDEMGGLRGHNHQLSHGPRQVNPHHEQWGFELQLNDDIQIVEAATTKCSTARVSVLQNN